MTTIEQALAKNRAEELGYDVWSEFVVPPFFPQLSLTESNKPKLIIGGRGCGKTMLLRYLSHQSTFSLRRASIQDTSLSHIGLYWRADTQFANAMQKREIPDDVWTSAFDHFAALVLGIELLQSLRSIADSSYDKINQSILTELTFPVVKTFDATLPCGYLALLNDLKGRVHALESWVSNVKKLASPLFLPGRTFLTALAEDVKASHPHLASVAFFVYVDEYENLVEYQQEIINTWVKQSEPPLIFNLAMKRNGFRTKKTVGNESLSDIHDYREHDIERSIGSEFDFFAAEILLFRLSKTGLETPLDRESLHDPVHIGSRQSPSYKQSVIRAAEGLLPSVSEEQMARDVFQDRPLSQKLRSRIELALTRKDARVPLDSFFRPEYPKASIVTPALLSRNSLTPGLILEEFGKYQSKQASRFDDWIHNNFIGSLLQLYEPLPRACPFYAGFKTFCQLSHGNIRYFIELCHQSLADPASEGLSASVYIQAEVARQASASFLKEIRSFGTKGNQLYAFALGLGSLFNLAQGRDSQSESEQNHFAVKEGLNSLSRSSREFLDEATKWSVLFESRSTKQKNEFEPEGTEYLINPIYAPYFHISYRKKRRLEISVQDLDVLIEGHYLRIRDMLKTYKLQWNVSTAEMPLFAHLEE